MPVADVIQPNNKVLSYFSRKLGYYYPSFLVC